MAESKPIKLADLGGGSGQLQEFGESDTLPLSSMPPEIPAALDDKVDKVSGQSLMTDAERVKLGGVATGAQVNTVTSVVGRTGEILLAKADVGLPLADNTPDIAKPVSAAQQSAISARVAVSDVLDVLTSTDAQKPLSANQGRVLKGFVDNIQSLLAAVEGAVVGYIDTALSALGISNIAGLQPALDGRYTKAESDSALADKVDKVAGQSLMTDAERIKLGSIAAGAQVNVATNIGQGTRTATTVPLTSSTGTSATLSAATTTLAGVMSAAQVTTLSANTTAIGDISTALDTINGESV